MTEIWNGRIDQPYPTSECWKDKATDNALIYGILKHLEADELAHYDVGSGWYITAKGNVYLKIKVFSGGLSSILFFAAKYSKLSKL